MKRKKIVVFLLSCIAAACLLFGCAQKEKGPKFLEGVITETPLGVDVLVAELVAFDESENYTFTITDPLDKEKDYTSRKVWIPEEVGEHTLTYTILDGKNKGSATHAINVLAREIEWSFDNFSTFIYQMGTTLEFADLFEDMNVVVQSDLPYTLSVTSVLVDGERIDLTGKTSYTFESLSDHVFRFRIDTEDGQYSVATVVVGVQYMEPGMDAWLAQNHIGYHNYLSVLSDRSVMLGESIFTGKADKTNKTDLAYISFDGEYGVGDYVQFDFTGSNLPQLCFFANETTPDLIDGKNGVYLANGFGDGMGSEAKRMTIYGPWKIKGAALGGSDRLKTETNSPIGATYLDESTRYRYIAGVSKVEETTYEKSSQKYTGLAATLHLLLIDLDRGEIVYDNEMLLNPMAQYDLSEEYFTGNIVACGMMGEKTKWDEIYPVSQNVSDIYQLVSLARFKEDAALTVKTGASLNVSDYIAPETGVEYELYYTNANGDKTTVSGDTFSFTQAGEYSLYYQPLDGDTLLGSLKVVARDMTETAWAFLQQNKVSAYGATFNESDGIVGVELAAGTYLGKDGTATGSTDVPYLKFGGSYGVENFVAVDFTGNNMPNISFFNDVAIESKRKDITSGTGIFLTQGILNKDATISATIAGRYLMYAPNNFSGNVWTGGKNMLKDDTLNAFTYKETSKEENANKEYRLIVGIHESQDGKIKYSLVLMEKNESGAEYEYSILCKSVAQTFSWAACTGFDFNGSIVIYGRPYQQTKLDKVHSIYYNNLKATVLGWTGTALW